MATPHTVTADRQARLGKRLAHVCLTPAHAHLPTDASAEDALAFDCIESTQGHFQKSDGEMSELLGGIAQSNYSRRRYNVARAERLPLEMRRHYKQLLTAADGMVTRIPTEQEKLLMLTRQTLRQVLNALLDFMDQQELAS